MWCVLVDIDYCDRNGVYFYLVLNVSGFRVGVYAVCEVLWC